MHEFSGLSATCGNPDMMTSKLLLLRTHLLKSMKHTIKILQSNSTNEHVAPFHNNCTHRRARTQHSC